MNIKAWQIFVFSLVPLALVFAGVIGGSFHGIDSSKETIPPTAAPSTGGAGTGGAAGANVLDLIARNTAFSRKTLTAAANTQITVRLTNQDSGVPHNVAFYRAKGQAQLLATGAKMDLLNSGTGQITFTTPAAGKYYFQCDVHPDQMFGDFTVN